MRALIEKELMLDSVDAEDVLEALGEHFQLRREAGEEQGSTYWDTFDWRVWNDGGLLVERPAPADVRAMILHPEQEQQEEKRREIAWCDHDGRLRRLAWIAGEHELGMAGDLPDELADLAPVLSMRRLMPMLHLRESGPRLRILGESEKTVVRLRLLEATAARDRETPPRSLPPRLRVEPVRGYDAEESRLLRFLADRFRLQEAEQSLFQHGLEALGRRPGDYSSKIRLQLEPSATALDAALAIHRALFDNMLTNEPGMRADLDSEFLHDFRVAVRRTRSALSQVKGVFTADVLEHFKRQFRWLGQITGPTRDLDVYLLKMPSYREDLPAEARGDLEPLDRFLVERQAAEQQRLVEQIESARYRDLIETWRRQLARPAAGPSAERPAIEVASARIWKLYRRMVKAGRAIDAETPAERLHEVRILGKKLRYLLEFFRSLYAEEEIDVAIKELKRLQDNLGDFNDYEVQEAAMGRFAEELSVEMLQAGEDPARTLLAMGRLQAHLDDGRWRERRRFHKRFDRFAGRLNRRRFAKLFAGG